MEWVNIIIQGVLIGGLYAMFAAGLVADLRRDAARQHRPRRSDRARRLYRADDDRHARPQSLCSPRRSSCRSWRRSAMALQRGAAQPHARRRRPAAAAGDLRPLRHHPERAAGAVHRRQPPAQGRRDRGRELPDRRRAFAIGVLAAAAVRASPLPSSPACSCCSTARRSAAPFARPRTISRWRN